MRIKINTVGKEQRHPQRRMMQRKLSIAGAAALEHLDRPPTIVSVALRFTLDGIATSPEDRALFDLPVLPAAAPSACEVRPASERDVEISQLFQEIRRNLVERANLRAQIAVTNLALLEAEVTTVPRLDGLNAVDEDEALAKPDKPKVD